MSVCLSVRPSHAGIVSKRLNMSYNLVHHSVFHTKRYGTIQTGTALKGMSNAGGMEKSRFSTTNISLRFISEMIQDRAIVTMERQ